MAVSREHFGSQDDEPLRPNIVVPRENIDAMDSVAPFALGMANVVMQLSRLPVGRGVAESRVDSGRLDLHPVKRLRTTLTFLLIALYGTQKERVALRDEINRAHRRVRSRPGDPVAYSAFDPDLQLWVAAAIYKGTEDAYRWLHGPLRYDRRDAFYRHGARFATTLQVPENMWPTDRAAFEEYWQTGVQQIEMDHVTREYLQRAARVAFMPGPIRWTFGPINQLLTVGFIEQPFRDQLGLPWTSAHQRAFDVLTSALATVNRILPQPLRRFPLNVYLWDARRRLRNGRPIV